MLTETVIFLHGYATLGGLQDGKARFFAEKFSPFPQIAFQGIDFTPTAKDFQYHTITGMIDRLRQYILERNFDQVSLIAISQGANVALNYAYRYGNVKQMLLLAPELFYDSYSTEEDLQKWAALVDGPTFHYGFRQTLLLNYGHHQDGLRYTVAPPPAAPLTIVHGRQDPAVPIERSRDYAATFPEQVRLVEVDSDHFLNDQGDLIWEQTRLLFGL